LAGEKCGPGDARKAVRYYARAGAGGFIDGRRRDATLRDGAAPGSALRATLNLLLREHVYLAADATGAALGGRKAEFEAAAAALDANSQDIARAIGSVYGADAEKAFLPLWRRHIGFVVDYTVGAASRD